MPIHGFHPVDPKEYLPERRTHTNRPFDKRPVHERSEIIPVGGIDVLSAAKLHEHGRQRAVAEMLCILGLLTSKGVLPKAADIKAIGALSQNGRGTKALPAAHCIPGHLLVDGIPLERYVECPPGLDEQGLHHKREEFLRERGFRPKELCDAIRELFERTEGMVQAANQVDSYIENQNTDPGLRELFGLAAGSVVSSDYGKVRGASGANLLQPVQLSFNFYRQRAHHKVCEAHEIKMKKRESMRRIASAKEMENIDFEVLLLRSYRDALSSGNMPSVLTPGGFEAFRQKLICVQTPPR